MDEQIEKIMEALGLQYITRSLSIFYSCCSKTFTIHATVTCPLAFLDWVTVEIVT